MRIKTALLTGLGLMVMGAAPAFADAKIYPYHAKANYCPAGLQPITISGVICCGTPNQSMSYQHVMMNAAKRHKPKRHVRRAKSVYDCPIGTKGCS
ncbi:hypothetical protein [Ascidiaceihabitans sp.]|uniref:hypothetical protein n=1 Tax=Ascidiaceihabitans sp. TaxID=1872644 RepID=UPI003299E4DF